MPGAVKAIAGVLTAETKTDNPEHMAVVMVNLLLKVQVGMHKAVMESAPPRTVEAAVAAEPVSLVSTRNPGKGAGEWGVMPSTALLPTPVARPCELPLVFPVVPPRILTTGP